jgi:UDP-galactopyranose mutase
MKKILIVGAGFSGAVIARELAEKGLQILIIDKRDHVAGNAFDYTDEHGIRIHKYGPHLFHTSNLVVVNWLSRFTEWIEYKHKVKALLNDGQLVTLPVNKTTASIVGEKNIHDIFYRPYTKKMWGIEIEELDSSIIKRVSIRDDDNEFYFPNDTFQALPSYGYTELVSNILDHPLIKVCLSTEFDIHFNYSSFDHVFNSMPIDLFFNFSLGELPYRSIKFHTYSLPLPNIYPVATVNFTHNEPYTRVTEWKNLPSNSKRSKSHTTITIEEPCDYKDNNYERYYPIKDSNEANLLLYRKYKMMVPPNMTFIGRCGLYAYLDMHQAISSALNVAKGFK